MQFSMHTITLLTCGQDVKVAACNVRHILHMSALPHCLPPFLQVPAGQDVMISVYNIHHSKAVWDDPEAFEPERFGPLDGPTPNEQNTDFRAIKERKRDCVGTGKKRDYVGTDNIPHISEGKEDTYRAEEHGNRIRYEERERGPLRLWMPGAVGAGQVAIGRRLEQRSPESSPSSCRGYPLQVECRCCAQSVSAGESGCKRHSLEAHAHEPLIDKCIYFCA
eukprot:scaffold194057_cov19-Tisochrysis_lutea.AAC.1